mgnify:CR=1 FL=1
MAGDEIKATGEGNLHLAYHSLDNALNIWGSGNSRSKSIDGCLMSPFTSMRACTGTLVQYPGNSP